ncbi:hypothetical protein O6H91_Y513700 [Diphasiastrum complanatum]|nr:hypothetical protein O6H91_Y513700 [Diphasiastrum complanatum]
MLQAQAKNVLSLSLVALIVFMEFAGFAQRNDTMDELESKENMKFGPMNKPHVMLANASFPLFKA